MDWDVHPAWLALWQNSSLASSCGFFPLSGSHTLRGKNDQGQAEGKKSFQFTANQATVFHLIWNKKSYIVVLKGICSLQLWGLLLRCSLIPFQALNFHAQLMIFWTFASGTSAALLWVRNHSCLLFSAAAQNFVRACETGPFCFALCSPVWMWSVFAPLLVTL